MANRHDTEDEGEDQRKLPRLYRRRFLTATGIGVIAGMAGLSSRGGAARTVIDLGDEGLQDGDDVSPYIDQYWNDGTEVHIPAGSYRYDGSGLHGKRGDCALIGSEDGVEFHRPDDDRRVAPTIQCTHGTLRVENITVRGAKPASANTEGSRWRFDALDPDSRCEVVNVNHPDGTEGCSDGVGFLTYDDHHGTVLYRNCYVANHGNSSFYVNLGYHSGESNPVIVDNCTIINPNGAIRGGHNDSVIRDTTFVWRKQPNAWVDCATNARGVRNDHGGHDNLIENCHFYFADGIGNGGAAIDPSSQGADTSGEIRDVYVYSEGDYGDVVDRSGWSYENIHITGSGSASAPISTGSTSPDLRNENAVWMPESQTVRPGGVSRGGDSTDGSSKSEGSMFEVVSTDSGADLSYAFTVDGTASKAEASQRNSSIGESNDTITDNGDGTVTVEGRTGFGYGDAFLVDGEVLSFERTGGDSGFQLLLDGQDVTDQFAGGSDEELASTFEVVSIDSGGELTYAFDVEGSAEKTDAGDGNSSVGESNDTITDNGDGTVTVEGKTGFGYGDAFLVTGPVSNFERTSGSSSFQLLLDGQDVTEDLAGPNRVYVDGTTAPEEVNAYRIEVTGDLQADPENSVLIDGGLAWDGLEDSVDGSTAVGVVGNGVDAYTYTGEIVDLTVDGGATTEVEN